MCGDKLPLKRLEESWSWETEEKCVETFHCVETNPDLGEKNQLQPEATGPMPEPDVWSWSHTQAGGGAI